MIITLLFYLPPSPPYGKILSEKGGDFVSKRLERISGLCPETNQTASIAVTFEEIWMLGSTRPGYKAISYSCAHADECECRSNGPDGALCPLFKSAWQKMF